MTIYKTLMYLQKSSRGGRENRMDSFFAGLVGGCYIFGNDSAVVQQVPPESHVINGPITKTANYMQMNLYVFARVMQGLARLAIRKGVVKDSRETVGKYSWPLFGSLTWATVMYLFRWYPEVIHVSLSTMNALIVAEHEKFDEVFICEFRQLGFLEEFLVAQHLNRFGWHGRLGAEHTGECVLY